MFDFLEELGGGDYWSGDSGSSGSTTPAPAEGGYGYEFGDDPLTAGGMDPTSPSSTSPPTPVPDGGYGYEFADDPLSAGGFGPNS